MLALLLLAQAAPAAPAPSPAQADARCIVAFGSMAGSDTEEVQRAAQLGALYFYGKLLGREPAVDLKAAMTAAATAVTANVRPELLRCGTELQRSGEALRAVGQALQNDPPAADKK